MSSKRSKSNIGVILLFLVGASGAAALGLYVRSGHSTVPQEDRRLPVAVEQAPPTKPTEEPKQESAAQANVLVPTMSGMDLTFKTESRPLPQGVNPMVFAVNEYLKQIPAVPKDARLIGVEVINHTAIMQFNHPFGDNTYGSEDEKAVLDGLCATMGMFPDVNEIKLEVEGKGIDSLGHVELSDPLQVTRLAKSSTAKPIEASPQPK